MVFCFRTFKCEHNHKKRKDNLESNLDWVLFAAELEFPKILVPRLPQNTSNVNIECTERLKQPYSLCDQLPEALIYINFFIMIVFIMIIIMIFFIIDYAWCKLCKIWLLLCENNSRSITIQELNTGAKHCCSYSSR